MRCGLIQPRLQRLLQKLEQPRLRLEQLLKHQNADGGWGWLVGQESDALATGQVLYALREIKLDTSHKSALAAQAWLVKSQQANGTWKVKGTKANKKDKFEETAIYWGTAWLGSDRAFAIAAASEVIPNQSLIAITSSATGRAAGQRVDGLPLFPQRTRCAGNPTLACDRLPGEPLFVGNEAPVATSS